MSASVARAASERLLLDTHVFLWWQQASRMLPPDVARRIAEADRVYVSIATAWELAIKVASGKLRSGESFVEAMEVNRFGLLPITLDHVDAVAALPVPTRHRDPFDRMLIAQAVYEGLTVVTHDSAFGEYPVPVLWA